MTTFDVADGVFGIDTGLFDTGFTSVYLFDGAEPTLLDTGSASSVDTILEGLRERDVPPETLSNIICSHVHTDHSGGAGELLAHAPEADIYIHELTASHLRDPSGLIESSRRAMGEHFEDMGEQKPVPDDAIVEVPDSGITLDIGASTLELMHLPGHSPDHFAVWNPERQVLFAAECLGNYFGRADGWSPPASLPNFDVEAVEAAIDQLRELDPERIVFPHFGTWDGKPSAAFDRATEELHLFDRHILETHESTGSVDETIQSVADELLDLSPPYSPQIESFQAELNTKGYLKYHGLF